jgi:uncharacterized protein YozE (UPF0346 family)
MKKFSKVVESIDEGYYKISAEIELIVKSDNEGEAGYMADDILGSIKDQYNYTILNIEKTEDRINESILSGIFNKSLIKKVNNCNDSTEFHELIHDIYDDSKFGKDGYKFNIINSNLENLNSVKEMFINYLKKYKLSDILIYGPTERKPGKSWMFSTGHIMQ